MIKAQFKSYGSYVTDSIYQWDLNQELSISGLVMSSAPVIAYSSKAVKKAIIVQSKIIDGVINCDIPNALLQFDNDITAHLCSLESKQYKAVEKMIIPVIKRAMPADYLFTDNVPILTYEAIEADIQQLYNLGKSYTDTVKNEIKVERERINKLISSRTFSENYIQSNAVFHAYNGISSGDPDPDDSYNYEGTSGQHTMPAYKNFTVGELHLAEKQSNEKVRMLKEGLFIFDLRVKISGTGSLDIEVRVNDTSQRYNSQLTTAQSTAEVKIFTYILYLKENDLVSFYGTPQNRASINAHVADVNCYAIDWKGKAQISDCSKEVSDIRVGLDGTIYDTAGQAVREQLKKKDNEINVISENLDDFTLEIEGKNINSSDNEIGYINDDGTLKNYADCWRSKDFISVKQNGNICTCQISEMNNVIKVCQYDKNKLFIKFSNLYMTRHHAPDIVTNIILDDNIAYIKLTASGINETNTLDKSKTAIYYFDGINYPLTYIDYTPPERVVDAEKVYKDGKIIKIPTKTSELINDSNFISANGDMDIKATVIFDFDAGARYDDRAKILEENGLTGTFHFNGNSGNEDLVNNSIPLYMKGGHDVSLYGGVGKQPTTYIGEDAEKTWYEYIKSGVEWFEKHGIFLGTMYACHNNKSSVGILNACKKLGFKFVRCAYSVVSGETWDTDKDCIYYNTGSNSPYEMPMHFYGMDKSFEEIKSAIDDAVAKGQTICLFTHTLAETTEGISMSKTIFRQVVEYVKSLKDAGSVDVLNAREYYDKYNSVDGEKRKYNRVMAGITSLSKVEFS